MFAYLENKLNASEVIVRIFKKNQIITVKYYYMITKIDVK